MSWSSPPLSLSCSFIHPATTEIYTLSLHDALPILDGPLAHDDVVLLAAGEIGQCEREFRVAHHPQVALDPTFQQHARQDLRSEEHTSELQSRQYLVCRLLLEKKNDALLAAPTRLLD